MIEGAAQLDLTPGAAILLRERCLLPHESDGKFPGKWSLFVQRVARHLASAEQAYGGDFETVNKSFLQIMSSLNFLPNSPTLMNAGTSVGQLISNCVLPVEGSFDSIFKAVKDSARVQAGGAGVGLDLSSACSRQHAIRSTGGMFAGPLPFLHIFDAVTECTRKFGRRRGANIVVLRVDHPDIEEFITLKENPSALTNMNISVGITDGFMEALAQDDNFCLIAPRMHKVVKTVSARHLFDQIVGSAWATGDPGLLFLNRINQDNPTPHLGSLQSTSPCGEVPLLPYESCVLGSVNLSQMIVNGCIDWVKLAETVRIGIRLLDNIIDVSAYPLSEVKNVTLVNRKIGLGVMGWADALVKLQIPYDSEKGLIAAEEVMEFISFHAKSSSIQLACQRGPFPEFENSVCNVFIPKQRPRGTVLQGRPILRWQVLMNQIRQCGIRNATVTAIAPTGSISTIANVSSGIEPYFALAYTRHALGYRIQQVNKLFLEMSKGLRGDDPAFVQKVIEGGSARKAKTVPEHMRRLFGTASEIDSKWHVRMQAAFQKYVDNALSKTVNLRADATQKEVAKIFLLAHRLGCKGITVYRDGSKNHQVLTAGI